MWEEAAAFVDQCGHAEGVVLKDNPGSLFKVPGQPGGSRERQKQQQPGVKP
jgi:hypothetical protein